MLSGMTVSGIIWIYLHHELTNGSYYMNRGKRGEMLAAEYLEAQQYSIIARNWHCQWGEIDIVAKTDEIWVFCEVKTRRSATTQAAFGNISERKRQRMIAAAQQYLHEHELDDAVWRIDAVGVAIPANGTPIIDHVEDVLDW